MYILVLFRVVCISCNKKNNYSIFMKLVCDTLPIMSEIRNIFYENYNESFNESDFEQSDEEFFSDPINDDFSEIQSEDDEDNSELESADDSDIIPRFQRRTRCISSSDSESS